jgi:lipoprotein-anchoring transpeptidase ErfK/SrfK
MLVPAKGPAASSWIEAQVELARRGFSCGSIDGVPGPKSRAALRAFQQNRGLAPTGELDAATKEQLTLSGPPYTQASLTAADLAGLQPLSKTWVGKSEQTALAHETALEAIAERFHAHPGFVRQLNPSLDWDAITPETVITVPAVEKVATPTRATRLQISLTDCVLEAFDADDKPIAHFPVSIGSTAEKRPAGELHVVTAAANPNFTFDPATFPESPEARELREQGRKLILPPGPNNPVGIAWIGLDRPGYGIHGTPSPERVGRAESHGCFRLANWDARTLLLLVRIGTPVQVEP